MSYDDLTTDAKAKLEKSLAALANDFRRVRTGRANPAMIEHVQVEAYGSMMPITQCASISCPEPTQLLIKPWDKGLLKALEKALIASDLGMAPNNDGVNIRLQLPPLSTERRKQLAGDAKDFAERAKVSMRNLRRDLIKAIETRGKEKNISEDVTKAAKTKIDELLKLYEGKAEADLKAKTAEILTI